MFFLIIGIAIGATIATNYDLKPFYENTVKPGIKLGIETIHEYTDRKQK